MPDGMNFLARANRFLELAIYMEMNRVVIIIYMEK